ncbi:TPA: PTS sugar transporter subunit IIA [Klebsiella michiganensis]|uniref:PTS sugar transporter subunit IIA n=1 Tax=Klebsiella TaxID=570 RepID=UPI000E077C2C|nr:PTS sugar transporter subunit IIA [Klebsiella michiganensis]MBZ7499075.1 PTS sugar transporter subunit IIA [Klebsiella michiganensis]WEF07041.1 PTS sugar transporter subunit IIA [Klebsiella michiganensis]STR65197.1 PTS system galactitol-specific transporter subunit IIA [Klebsiella michiganensis]HDS8774784.1 PTS sugar transporter subunit IIA [Klebsiella michiganensis]
MSIASSIDNDFILLNHPGGEREALFREINNLLADKGFVEETYLQALINREENNPTAMQLERIGVAIPHVDVEHIKEEKLVVVSCPEGIEFKQAEDPDEVMTVHVIFFLLLKEKDAHIDFLMKLIGLFRQTEQMDTFLTTQSPEEVKKLLTAALN